MIYSKIEEMEVRSAILAYEDVAHKAIQNKEFKDCLNQLKLYNEELYYHSYNVSLLSFIVGNSLHLDNLSDLYIAAFLHDFGKIFIPKEILEKPGNLNEKEWSFIKLHPELGYIYLKQRTKFSNEVLNGILDHHERVDGTGYGFNKVGSEISLIGRIVALADVYDAMIANRVYRKKIDRKIAKSYIKENAGKHFDFELTILFLSKTNIYEIMEHNKQ